ncbi:MAG: hypothetical protein ACYC7H_14020, partial [Chloroflexota bacterium]
MKYRLRLTVSMVSALLVTILLAALATAAGAGPTAQAQDDGWLLTFTTGLAPGETPPGPLSAVAVDERSDHIYTGGWDGRLQAYDRHTQQQTGRARTEHTIDSLAVDAASGRLFAAGVRYQDQTVHLSVFSLPDLRLERSLQLADGALLRRVLFDPERRHLYALLLRIQGTVSTSEVLALGDRGEPLGPAWLLGDTATAGGVDPATGHLLTLFPDFQATAATLRAYAPDGTLTREAQIPARATQLVVDPTRRRAYAIAADGAANGRLITVDLDSFAVLNNLTVSRQPAAAAVDAQTGQVWLAATRASAPDFAPVLEVVDPKAGITLAIANYGRPVGIFSPEAMVADAGTRRLWVANQDNSLAVLNLDSRQPVATIVTGDVLGDVAVDGGSGRVFVLSSNADTLYAVDPAGGGIVGSVTVGRNPISMRVDERSGRVYVLNQTARSVSIVDGRTMRAVAEFPIAVPPAPVSWDVDPAVGRLFLFQNGEVVAVAVDTGREVGRAKVDKVGLANAALTVDRDTHRIYVTGYASAILDDTTLTSVGELPASPLSLAIDGAARRGYAVNWCTAKSCGVRTYVYDLRDNSLLAQLEGVGEITALNPSLGHLYFAGSPAFVVDAYSFESTRLDWRATDIAADPGRGRIYLLDATARSLRAVPDTYPRSAASSRERPWAKIEIVWPHDGAPVGEANLANVGATLFQPTTLRALDTGDLGPLRLWRAVNNEPAAPVAVGSARSATANVAAKAGCASPVYRVWDFDDVDVSPARDPANKVYFFLTADGQPLTSNIWGHAADA